MRWVTVLLRQCARDLWIYDLCTNQHFTLKTNPLTRVHLDDFVSCYRACDRTQRE